MVASLGIGSGLDLGGLVKQLVAAEGSPLASRLNSKEATYQAQLSALGSVKSTLSQVADSLTGLQDLTISNSVNVSGEDKVLSASVDDTASVGSYQVSVSQLATANSLASTTFATSTTSIGSGTLTFTFGTTVYDSGSDIYTSFTANTQKSPVTVTIQPGADSLEDIRDAINTLDAGVTASIVNDGSGYRLTFTSDDTGAANSLEVTVDDDDLDDTDNVAGLSRLAFNSAATNVQQTSGAQDAALTINGLAITSESNAVDKAITGLTLNLEGLTTTTPVTVNVSRSSGSVITVVNNFVARYNEFVALANELTVFNRDSGVKGTLLGDITLRNATSALRNVIVSPIRPGDTTLASLVDLGISTGEKGVVSIDLDKLNSLLDADYDDTISFIQSASTAIEDSIKAFTGNNNVLDARTDGLQKSIADIGVQRAALDVRLTRLEARFTKQFSALDALVANLTSTSNFLTQALSNLPGVRKFGK